MTKKTTEIIFLLDRSGSMSGLETDTIGGFNSFVKMQNKLPGKMVLTTVLFDHESEILWNGIDATDVKLTEKDYFVRGSTALLDAVGNAIVTVRSRETTADNVVFVITTDGMENSSIEFTAEKIKALIEHQQERYGWKFIFLGANINATEEAGKMGITKERSYNYSATSAGVGKMYETVNAAVMEDRKE